MPYNQSKIGYQKNDASKEAASFNLKGKLTIRQQVFELFKEYKSLTVEDVSKILDRAEISVQPRVSELKNDGLIEDSGKKSMGKWGTSITVWRLADEQMEETKA